MDYELIKQAGPGKVKSKDYAFDSFKNGEVLENKHKNKLPAMGWNSWNAFGSGNTEALTKMTADKMVELGLDKLGYKYIVLDDGCYCPERKDDRLVNEPVKFPSGFKALADYVHDKGLKFGMYNDIGTNLCAGALVGTCGHEDIDAASYVSWDVDFLKVDNCYYLWDNATFSDASNARFVYAPMIKSISIKGIENETFLAKFAATDAKTVGEGVRFEDGCALGIGTFDGTGPERTPMGSQFGELLFDVDVPCDGTYLLSVEYAAGEEIGIGSWLEIAVGVGNGYVYDDLVCERENADKTVRVLNGIELNLNAGNNTIRLCNHRRQENTLASYARLLEGLNKAGADKNMVLSICEWGKTQPQNWGNKVGDSWRILNDITFNVGRDGDPGLANWEGDYTTSITAQYNKAVIMDEFSGIDKGYNDPDMLVLGMNGLTETMNRTHMVMWCMMNSPLMLGMDLRRVVKGDWLYNIITNERLISLNQDALGIQAKRAAVITENEMLCCSSDISDRSSDREYIRDNDRVDVLVKPLADGSVALSIINLSNHRWNTTIELDLMSLINPILSKMCNAKKWMAVDSSSEYRISDLWNGEEKITDGHIFIESLEAYDNMTVKITLA